MKTETRKLYSGDFEYFCQIPSKTIISISSYTVLKLGSFLRQCTETIRVRTNTGPHR